MRTDELYAQKKEEPSTVSQILSQIRTLQDKVSALNEEKEFHNPQTASSSGVSHVPSQPSRIPSPRGMLSRDSGLPPHYTRNSMGTSGNVFESLPAQETIAPSLPGIAMRHGEGLRREPQSSTRPTPRFFRDLDAWNSMRRTGGTYSQIVRWKLLGMLSRNCMSENAQDQMTCSAGESISRPKCA